MSKFKVGDKCRVLQSYECHACRGKLLEIISIDNGSIYPIKTKTSEGHEEIFKEECLVLVIPLTNTIITDIKDEAQHKRVQEKLFEMGILSPWAFQDKKKMNPFSSENIVVGDGNFWNRDDNNLSEYGAFGRIPASEFLGEIEDEINPEFAKLGIPYGKSLPDKIQTNQNILEEFGKMFFDESVNVDWNKLNKLYNNPTPTPCGEKGIKKVMSNIITFIKDSTLSKEEKALRVCELHDEKGNWTGTALEVARELEAKELGYNDLGDMCSKNAVPAAGLSVFEAHTLLTKHAAKITEQALAKVEEDKKK